MAKVELKQPIVDEIKAQLDGAKSMVVVDYRGISVADVTELRKQCREAGVVYKVYKNTMVKRAVEGTEFEGVVKDLEGTNAFAISKEDATAPARIVANFIKKAKCCELKSGVVEGTYYDAAGIATIATIPSRDELIAKFMGSIQSPVTNFARVIKQIAEQKDGGAAESEAAGSGFIVAKTKDNLMIATNNHVVSDATSLTVGFADDTTAKATVVGTDSSADLAVISVKIKDIKDSTASKIKVATLGSSDDLKVGEEVVAIGNALGYGQSVTTGVVSAKNREVSLTDGTMNLLQTDAAINPGNSGGVLINMDGQVVGINNAKLEDTSVEGMGYAIPITTAKTILTDLMNAGSVSTKDAAFLGVVGRDINESYSSALGIPSGIYVSQVVSGSPAEKAGISAGDVIVKFEGNNVSTMSGLKEKLAIKKANTKVKITFKRANQSGTYEEKTVTVTLGKKSDFKNVTTDNSSDSSESDDSSNNGNSNGNSNNGNNNGNSGNSNGNSGNGGYGYDNGNGGNSSDGYMNPYDYFFGNNY